MFCGLGFGLQANRMNRTQTVNKKKIGLPNPKGKLSFNCVLDNLLLMNDVEWLKGNGFTVCDRSIGNWMKANTFLSAASGQFGCWIQHQLFRISWRIHLYIRHVRIRRIPAPVHSTHMVSYHMHHASNTVTEQNWTFKTRKIHLRKLKSNEQTQMNYIIIIIIHCRASNHLKIIFSLHYGGSPVCGSNNSQFHWLFTHKKINNKTTYMWRKEERTNKKYIYI